MDADNRKGELAELKGQLRSLAGSRAPGLEELKRELYKRVISYMTIGIDVSSLFSEMVMCSATSDLILKKMCYLYVCNYAVVNPELALLTINFLQKDCSDEDPMIRGLALRSLCSLRVKGLVEYLVGPLKKGLQDSNPYVRFTAAMGVLKLYNLSPSSVTDNDFTVELKSLLLHDPDPQVVVNSLCSLQEIFHTEASKSNEESARERDYLSSKVIVYALLNRIKECSEWGQCLVLEVVAKYTPEDPSETFDIMNVLEDRLQHANSAVVLATVKVFLHLTMSMADVHQQVYERIKAPLLTLISTGSPEVSYAVLSHLNLLVGRAPILFAPDFKHFYCKFSDPSYVKKLKIEMLTAVANENNTYEIVSELCEYAANVDVAIARMSVRAVGQIVLQSYDVNGIVERLLQFLDMDTDYITAETLVLVRDLLRKYPQWSQDCIAVVGGVRSSSVQEPKAKAALIWLLGEYGQDMADAPYIIEGFIESWEEEDSAEVRLELLTAVAKLFFKRPPECQKILGAAVAAGLSDSQQDIHDRALLYYRLLQAGIEAAERVINPPKQVVSVFADAQSSEAKDRIFDEFNTLAVVYDQPSYMFLDKEHRGQMDVAEIGETQPDVILSTSAIAPDAAQYSDNDTLLSPAEKEESQGLTSNGPRAFNPSELALLASSPPLPAMASQPLHPLPVSQKASSDASLASQVRVPASPLTLDDLLGPSSPAPAAAAPSIPPLQLVAKPSLDAGTFQQKWGHLPVSQLLEERLQGGAATLTSPTPLLKHMATKCIQCMASGGQPPNFKFFFYAQAASLSPGAYFLVELHMNTSTRTATVKLKADDNSLASAFTALLKASLAEFG
eukprot:SM000070S21352  [mRNA]  locus=s70:581897:587414:+ [translate_table: standard]